jgi:hypothetical protein
LIDNKDAEFTDEGFVSCGSSKGKVSTGISSTFTVQRDQEKYAEPFSNFGRGQGLRWDNEQSDGISKQSEYSSEDETIIQRERHSVF